MKYINLPHPTPEMLDAVRRVSEQMSLEPEVKEYLNNFYDRKYNIADFVTYNGVRNSNKAFIDLGIVKQIKELYEPIIGEIHPTVSKQVNVNPTTLATVGPHCDRKRLVGVNYILDLGGDDVITKVYNETRKDLSKISEDAENDLFENVTLAAEYKLPKNKWICFNPQRYHSVDNIENTRLMLFLLIDRMNYEDFINEYNHLLVDI